MADVPAKKFIHILWAPNTGPIVSYVSSSDSHRHALTMVGVQVTSCELLERLPPHVREDIYFAELEDFEEDETPVDPLPPPPAGPKR